MDLEIADEIHQTSEAAGKPTAETMRDNNARLAGIIDSAMAAIITVDPDRRISVFNRAAETLFDCPAEEAIGESLENFARTHITTGARRGLVPVFSSSKELPIQSEIAARNRPEQWLGNCEERYRLLVEQVQDYGIFMLAKDGRIISWNAGAEQIKGYQANEIVGRHFSVFYTAEDIQSGKPDNELRLAAQEGRIEDEGWRLRKDGTRFWADVVITALRDEHGKLRGFSKVTRDITKRKQDEEKIKRLNTRLERHAAHLEATNKELEAFSYSISHDLRAPLRHINGFSQALLEDYADILDDTGKDYLQQVRGASQEMAQLIDDVLQLARVTRSEMCGETVNLTELAHSIMTEIQNADATRTVTLHIEEGLSTHGDKRLLGTMLSNLLANAWKFTAQREQAQITLAQSRNGDEPVYFIRDNGAGFDMSFADKLFGAFQRLHGAGEFEGKGIGLATVQRIINRHGGRVWAESAVDQGATFYFTLGHFEETGNEEHIDLIS
jgi:PAS domain S-box-containing protein